MLELSRFVILCLISHPVIGRPRSGLHKKTKLKILEYLLEEGQEDKENVKKNSEVENNININFPTFPQN